MSGRNVTDQAGRIVPVPETINRIVSIVPSQTELLFDLGLSDRIIGVTKYCVHPLEECKAKTDVGGTKKLDIEVIRSLQPDLIIANKEENLEGDILELDKEFPVWVSDVSNLDESLAMIYSVGQLTNKDGSANQILNDIQHQFSLLTPSSSSLTCLYMIWRKPYMVAGTDTFVNDLLARCGFLNVAPDKRYPELTNEQIKEINPDVILLSSEPLPFSEKHTSEFEKIAPNAKIILVDGEMFSWYGSRLRLAPEYFKKVQGQLT